MTTEAEILAAFNSAADANAVLALINANSDTLLDADRINKMTDLPDGQGREQAIGLGVNETRTLLGNYTSLDALKTELGRQIDTEHAKYLFIQAVDNASTVGEMANALSLANILHLNRQELIQRWDQIEGNAALDARVAALKADSFTIVLNELAGRLDDTAFLEQLATKVLAARDALPEDKFYGVVKIVDAIAVATDAIDNSDLLAAFNGATTTNATLDAIDNYASTLLTGESATHFNELPDRAGRQQAIANGLIEIKTLFGDYATAAALKTALEAQIAVEYAKHLFILALDNATTAAEMATAIADTIVLINDHRQNLIEEWSQSTDAAVQARVTALQNDPYTRALAEIVANLANANYMAELGSLMLTARNALTGGKFFGVVKIADALLAADQVIDVVHDAVISGPNTGTIAEDGAQNPSGTLLITDEDWGEAAFQTVAAADLTKEYGTFTFDAMTGAWTFTINTEAAQALKADQEVQQTLTVKSLDGTATQTIAVTVQGANDTASISGTHAGRVTEDGAQDASGTLSITDSDEGEKRFQPVTAADLEKQYGTFAFNAETGAWTFTIDNEAAQSLDAGEEIEQTLTVTSLDGTATQTITVIVVGKSEDSAVISGTYAGKITEDEQNASGDLDVTDEDEGEDAFKEVATADLKKQYGTFAFNAETGAWSFKVDNAAAQSLKAGQEVQQTLTVKSLDGSATQTITVTVTGKNDAPNTLSLTKSEVSENATASTVIGQLTATDPDKGDIFTYTLLDDAGGRFALSTVDGVTSLVVKDGLKLDYEQAKSHTVKVLVKDAAGATFEKVLTVDLKDVADETASGGSSADVLKGGAGKDTFIGGAGDDKLWGGLGNDVLTGGIGKDIFVFDTKTHKSTNKDKIVDFNVKDDTIWLDNAIFKKLGSKGTEAHPAQLKSAYFTIGAKAKDKNDYIVYDNKKGVLYYDEDGSGRKKAVEIATLTKKLKITHKDFFVF